MGKLDLDERIRKLAERSRFKKKIFPLLSDPELGSRPFKNGEFSNCFGTTAYVLGINNLLWYLHPEERFRSQDLIFPLKEDRPGYVAGRIIYMFLKDKTRVVKYEERTIDDIVSFGEIEPDELTHVNINLKLIHTGVYLGELNNEEIMFHQKGYGGEFKCIPVFEYSASLISFHRIIS
jgi:hypothetical protein